MRHKGCYLGPILILFVATSANLAIAQDVTVDGNLFMHDSSPTVGNLLKDGVPFLHNFGANNTFLGLNAGNLSMTGTSNTAMGFNALFNNTTGFYNTAAGDSALLNNTDGFGNTAIGFQAMLTNTTGANNTATGVNALFNNTTGFNNTGQGYSTLFGNTTGTNNTALGHLALTNNSTGAGNTASGSQALVSNTTGNANTSYGAQALFNNITGSNNTAVGRSALQNNAGGSNSVAIGYMAASGNATGNRNTAIGANTVIGVENNNATAIGYGAVANSDSKVRIGNTEVTVIEGQVPYTFTSDVNEKENFVPVDGEEVLAKIRGMSLTSWNYIGHHPKQFRHYGPMAQDFFAAFGHDGVGTIGTETTINSGDMEGVLMIAVQALEKRTSELATLKVENADLKARLEKVERSIGALVVETE